MVQGYPQQDSESKGGWTSYLASRRTECGKLFAGTSICRNEVLLCSYTRGVAYNEKLASLSEIINMISSKKSKLYYCGIRLTILLPKTLIG